MASFRIIQKTDGGFTTGLVDRSSTEKRLKASPATVPNNENYKSTQKKKPLAQPKKAASTFNPAPAIEAATKTAEFLNSTIPDPFGVNKKTTRLASKILTSDMNPLKVAIKADLDKTDASKSPKLRTMRKDDGDYMDRTPTLPNSGDFGRDVSVSWEHGKKQLEADFAQYDSMLNIADLSKSRKANALQYEADSMAGMPVGGVHEAAKKGTTELIKYGIRGAADMLPMQLESIKEGVLKGALGSMMAGGAGAVVGASATGPFAPFGATGGAVSGAAAGFKAGFTAGSFETTAKIEAAQAYREYRNMGLSHESAYVAALGAGAVNGALEVAELGVIAKVTPGLNKILGSVKKEVTEGLYKPVKDFVGAWTAESSMEVVQQAFTLAGEAYARHKDKLAGYEVDDFDKSKVAGELLNTGIEAAVSMPWLLGGSMGAGYVGKALTQPHKALNKNLDSVEELLAENKEADNPETAEQLKALEVSLTKMIEAPETANKEELTVTRDRVIQLSGSIETQLAPEQASAIEQRVDSAMTATKVSYEDIKKSVLSGEIRIDNPSVTDEKVRLFAAADKAGIVQEVLARRYDGQSVLQTAKAIEKKVKQPFKVVEAVEAVNGEIMAQVVDRVSQDTLALPEPEQTPAQESTGASQTDETQAVEQPEEVQGNKVQEPPKPAWEMSSDEYFASTGSENRKLSNAQHIKAIQDANEKGEKIPEEVLTEYEGLLDFGEKKVEEGAKVEIAPRKRNIVIEKMNKRENEVYIALSKSISPDDYEMSKTKTYGLNYNQKQDFLKSMLSAYEEASETDENISFTLDPGYRPQKGEGRTTYTLANDTRVIARMMNRLGIKPKKVVESNTDKSAVASGGPVPAEVKIVEPNHRTQTTAASIAKSIGVDVVFFDAGNESVAGFYTGDGKLYINANLKSGAIMRTVGHEFFHSVRGNMPEMYDEMISFARDRFPDEAQAEYMERFAKWPDIYDRMKVDKDYLLEEMLSDEMGNTFAKEGFWADLYHYSKSLFDKVIDFINDFFNEVKSMEFKSTLEPDTIEELQWRFGQIVSFAREEVKENGSYEPRYSYSMQEDVYEDMSFHETVRENTVSKDFAAYIKNPKYRVIGNEESRQEAVNWLTEKGEQGAYAYLVDPQTPATNVSNVAAMLLIAKYQSNRDTMEMAHSILDAVSLKANNQGRAIQVLSMFGLLNGSMVIQRAKRTFDKVLTGKQKKELDETTDTIGKAMNKANKKAADDITQGDTDVIVQKTKGMKKSDKLVELLKDDLRRGRTFKEQKALPQNAVVPAEGVANPADEAAERLADRVEATTKEQTPKEIDPINLMVNTLFQIAKESSLPEQAKNIPTPLELVVHAIKNRAMYTEVWDKAKTIVEERLKDNPEAMEVLDKYFAMGLHEGEYLDKQVGKLIDEKLKELQVKVREIVRKHYSETQAMGVTLRQRLIQEAGLSGEDARIMEIEITRKINELTEAEKTRQLEALFKEKAKPGEKKQLYQKIIEQSNLGAFTNGKYRPLVSEKLGLPTLTEELGAQLTAMADEIQLMPEGTKEEQRARNVRIAQMMDIMAAQIPPTFWKQVATIHTIGQLLNFKTTIRNLLGNTGMFVFEMMADSISVPLDMVAYQFTKQRTKTFKPGKKLFAMGQGFIEGWNIGLEDAVLGIDTSSTHSKHEISNIRTFREGPLAKIETAMAISLRASDRAFYAAAFAESIVEQIEIAGVNEATPEMVEVAHAIGLYRTFQDENYLSKIMVGAKKALNAGQDFGVGDFIIKYPKTPANLLMRGIDYSPAGFVVALVKLLRDTSGNEYLRQKVAVEGFGRAATGTGLLAIGILMAQAGLVTGSDDDSEDYDAKQLLSSEGLRKYVVNVSAAWRWLRGGGAQELKPGDTLSTYDWFQPMSIVLAMGADIGNNAGVSGFSVNLISALETGLNTWSDQSVLQGIKKLFGKDTMAEGVKEVLSGALASFVPTILSQVAAVTDNTARNTYDARSYAKTAANMAEKKIPGASTTLEPAVTPFGKEAKNYPEGTNMLLRIADKFLNPSIVKQYNPSAESELVIQLLQQYGEDAQGIAPPRTYSSRTITVDGKPYTLTPREYTVIAKWVGTETEKRFKALLKDGINDWSSDENKIDALKSAVGSVNSEARDKVLKMKGIKEGK